MLTAIPFLAVLALLAKVSLAQKCTGQSCYVATLSGSTEEPYTIKGGKKPTGGNALGDNCIKNWYKKLGMPPPQGLKRFPEMTGYEAYETVMNDFREAKKARRMARGAAGSNIGTAESAEASTYDLLAFVQAPEAVEISLESEHQLEKRAACTPWELLYARGTTESGALGATVGPALSAGLSSDKKWSVRGISSADGYNADLNGIYCIGMTGGMACKKILEDRAKACPNTKFVTSGYSQGAMVARICVAFAEEETKKRVAGILTYGDPFNGATVKGFPQDKIKINCNPTDGVCKGDFSIGVGHLSYSTSSGVAWLKELSSKG